MTLQNYITNLRRHKEDLSKKLPKLYGVDKGHMLAEKDNSGQKENMRLQKT